MKQDLFLVMIFILLQIIIRVSQANRSRRSFPIALQDVHPNFHLNLTVDLVRTYHSHTNQNKSRRSLSNPIPPHRRALPDP